MAVRFLVKQFQNITRPFLPVLWVPLVYTILASFGLILNFWTTGDMVQDERFHKEGDSSETYDFIVVGAGSAGGLVANRLSKKYKVILLEAGGEPNPLQFIPGFSVFCINYPETDWMHKTVPQKYGSLNSVNQQSSWSAGKTLGGTGTLNLMVHLRGHKKDFDNWGKILNDPSWSWEGVLPFFKSYEDYEEGGHQDYHGFGGDLRVETPDYVGLGPEFIRAGGEFGYPNCDLNAPFTEGFDTIKYPIKHGVRQSSYKAFIEPIRHTRRNLVIRKFAHVNRVLIRDGNVAYGVEYDRFGTTRQVFASKEVIISAGTVNTPKLLMLSGIGPRSHLQSHGIPVISDLPVGDNLQDHVAAYMGPYFVNKPRTILLDRDLTPSAFVQWFLGGRGILSSTGVHATGILSSSLAKGRGEGDWPDIQYFLFGFSVFKNFADTFAHGFGLTKDEQHKFWDHGINKESMLVGVSGARPYSRGFVRLGGPSPYDAPIIDPRYFTDEGDQDLLSIVEGIKILNLLIENSTALGKELGATYTTQRLPGCEHLTFRSDEYWECYVRRYTVTLHHPVGTASLGTVVDTQLKVIGVDNLRVMDCSVEPVLVVTNTQASALMIGEKGADMVLKYWLQKEEEEKFRKSKYGPPNYKPAPPLTKFPSGNEYGAPTDTKYGAPPPKQFPQKTQYGAPEPVKVHYSKNTSPTKYQYEAPSPPSFPNEAVVQYGAPPPTSTKKPEIQYGPPLTPPQPSHLQKQYGAPPTTSSAIPDSLRFELPPQALAYAGPSWIKKRSSADPFTFDKIGNSSNYIHMAFNA